MMTGKEEELYTRLYYKEEELRTLQWHAEDQDIYIRDLVTENEHLKAQVYNLHLYLKTMWENVTTGFNKQVASDFYDGMPGYGEWTEEILTDE